MSYLEEAYTIRKHAKAKRICAQCSRPLPKGRTVYCDDYCSEVFFVRFWGAPWSWVRPLALKRDNNTCRKCGVKGDDSDMEVDHILERELGGQDDSDNLQTLCHKCHVAKTTEFLIRLRGQQAHDRRREKQKQLEASTTHLEEFIPEPLR